MRATSTRAVRVGVVVLAQLALVGVAVWAPLSARLTGETVVLRVEPVDPIDPFRGAYVQLAYPDLPDQAGPDDGSMTDEQREALDEARGTAYVPLTRSGEVWVGGPVQRTPPADGLYLTCDDVAGFVERMTRLGVACAPPVVERWGSITQVTLPGGGSLGVYEPTHPSPTGASPA